jgi:hypothetical protein
VVRTGGTFTSLFAPAGFAKINYNYHFNSANVLRQHMASQYHGEIRDHLDKNFPYIVVIFDDAGNLAAEIPARNLAEAAIDLHRRVVDLDRVVGVSPRTQPELDKPYAVNRRNFKHEQ